jgi:TRAP-type mannitol/chloroaromatic compound transport system substrate-binding protein
MDRRTLLRTGAVGAAAALAAPAIAQGTRTLKLAGTFPRGFPGLGQAAERLAARITAMTDGALTVQYFGGGELVPPFGVNDAVSTGAADMGHTAAYFAAGKIKATMYFTTLPYGLSASEISGWIQHGGGQALWDELYQPFNLKPLPVGNSMSQAGGWFKKPINSLDDLQGLKMRIAGLGGAVMQKIGMSTVNLPPPEIFPALQSGVVDAAEFVGPWNDVALGLSSVAPHYYMPAPHEPGALLECLINLEVWNSLTDSQRAIIEAAALAQSEETTGAYAYNNAIVLEQLIKDGVVPGAFPDDVVAALGVAAKEVIAAYPIGDPMSEKIHGGYVDYIKQCALNGKLLEGQMYMNRAAVWGV